MSIKNVIIIAEAGVNHNGNLNIAKQLIDEANSAGADYIKFQTFVSEDCITKDAKKADYQVKNTNDNKETQLEMVKRLELSKSDHDELIQYCSDKNVNFLSTAFDFKSIDLLEEYNLPFFKIASSEMTNLPLLRKVGGLNRPILLSTGMANLKEVKATLNELYNCGVKKQDVIILHCNTEYPTPMKDVNLNAMLSMKSELGLNIGYSDHSLGIEVPIAAVALGATVIEKHFTLDNNMVGPDHKASLVPHQLKAMVDGIRNIEQALGNGIKEPSISEKKNIPIMRKSIVAIRGIKKGEIFTGKNLTVKRPGTGISPMKWDEIIGTTAIRDFNEDEIIEN